MEIVHFDELSLTAELSRLPADHRTAFAAACAERLFPSYLRYLREGGRGDPDVPRTALNALWDALAGHSISTAELSEAARRCEALVPDENKGPLVESLPQAEDAIAALVYALESKREDNLKYPTWVARRAYEAVDRSVMHEEGGIIVTREMEERVLAHPIVQIELMRQRRDLRELRETSDVKEVASRLRRRAEQEDALGAPT